MKSAITKLDAEYQELVPVTHPYEPEERWMLDRAVAQLQRSKIKFALVVEDPSFPDKLSIWRF